MNDLEKLELYLAEAIGIRVITDTARKVVEALVALERVQNRFPSLSPAELQAAATLYLDRVHALATRKPGPRKTLKRAG